VTPATLTPGATYFARVSAYNSEGWSAPALAALSTVTENQLPEAPLNVAVSVYSSTSLEVSWTAVPHSGGDPVSRYLVQWDQDETFDDSTGTAIVEAIESQTEYTYRITGLTTDSYNVVRVMAYNQQGYGEPTLAVPIGAFEEIQEITVMNSTKIIYGKGLTYQLNMTAGGRSELTSAIKVGASAWKLQESLQALKNVGAVVVTRYDHSQTSGYDQSMHASEIMTDKTKFVYRITFVAPSNEGDVHQMAMVKS
jgi:hypothetical protein